MDLQQQRDEANRLRTAKDFARAEPLYRSLWTAETRNAWDGWGLAFCLQKTRNAAGALDICRETYRLDPGHAPNRQLYARIVYDMEVRGDQKPELTRMRRAVDAILRLTTQDDRYAPYVQAVFAITRRLQDLGHHEESLEWLDRLDAHLLGVEPDSHAGPDGKMRTFPSDAQQYFQLRAKASHECGDFEACRETVATGLSRIVTFANDGDVWLKRLDALSRAALGDLAGGYAALKALLHHKRDWFFHADLAGIARQMGNSDEAWSHATHALLARVGADMRIGIINTVSEWLEEDGRREEARAHYELVLAVRNEKGWTLKPEHQRRAAALGCETGATGVAALERPLKKQWQVWQEESMPRCQGRIERLLGEGGSGFVRTDGGDTHYFVARDLRGGEPREGLRVSFRTAPGFDRKKNIETVVAVDLRPA